MLFTTLVAIDKKGNGLTVEPYAAGKRQAHFDRIREIRNAGGKAKINGKEIQLKEGLILSNRGLLKRHKFNPRYQEILQQRIKAGKKNDEEAGQEIVGSLNDLAEALEIERSELDAIRKQDGCPEKNSHGYDVGAFKVFIAALSES